ncbi:helix-turn-helix transcriptional regulator [Corynebacterium sp. zg-331]|uniref:winged helix-turn-helix transcriptional regulator n=1 Tax=unclassified Corynebacterium TaxID=2624378 RepID=UPI00128B1F7E|nr:MULTISPECIES: helix-turn-helix domain-containing protein [unclassified Corynebacterium]MBC3185819.1 helix-turn-helix transcriptional regulator [Corynebacterium sp. zg-331]MPV52311.1 transcriptional regulator [Corynebacterium sp. zg331]
MSMPSPSLSACPIARTLEIVGEKWSLLILRDIARGLHRFSDIHHSLNCPKNLLSARLKALRTAGLVRTEEYREPGARARNSYHLTPAGVDLLPTLLALQSWGLAHLDRCEEPLGPVIHDGCGARVNTRLACEEGHDVRPRELRIAEVTPRDRE